MEEARFGIKTIVYGFLAVAAIVLLAVFGTWLYQEFQGDLLSRDFQNVKHSQAYVESTNAQMRGLITEFYRAETGFNQYRNVDTVTAESYKAQMRATVIQIYNLSDSLSPEEVAPDVQAFLDQHVLEH